MTCRLFIYLLIYLLPFRPVWLTNIKKKHNRLHETLEDIVCRWLGKDGSSVLKIRCCGFEMALKCNSTHLFKPFITLTSRTPNIQQCLRSAESPPHTVRKVRWITRSLKGGFNDVEMWAMCNFLAFAVEASLSPCGLSTALSCFVFFFVCFFSPIFHSCRGRTFKSAAGKLKPSPLRRLCGSSIPPLLFLLLIFYSALSLADAQKGLLQSAAWNTFKMRRRLHQNWIHVFMDGALLAELS